MSLFFFFNDPATTEIYTLSLHDALPILKDINRLVIIFFGIASFVLVFLSEEILRWGYRSKFGQLQLRKRVMLVGTAEDRSEEHTSELQSRLHLVCRLLLEKKKKK